MALEVDMFQDMNNYVTRRTGHARFRRGPIDQSTTSTSSYFDDQPTQNSFKFKASFEDKAKVEECKSAAGSSISSEILLIAGEEATVSNGVAINYSSAKPPLPLSHRKKLREIKQCVSMESPILSESSPARKCYSSAKPPLPSSHRKRSHENEQVSGDQLSSHSCHCCKRRKKIEITRRVRILKGSSLSILADEYSWKKYNHKLSTGSSSSGGYYKCSSVKGCSARKHVIKDKNDPMVLTVTYKGEHSHRLPKILSQVSCSDLNRILAKSI
ncbi:WRKY domain-containing protein [Heracleum sosnowskyi]|uniref:WRKY domain-containing protein n=1 Tax=Heracleum sosnowskyi TaxID=360622 RepID=A0AAD8MAJ3_9APIA|nr:WRKY domain-containing protein [Heracleum sosnowskyi]